MIEPTTSHSGNIVGLRDTTELIMHSEYHRRKPRVLCPLNFHKPVACDDDSVCKITI